MIVAIPKETAARELRVALVPDAVPKLTEAGLDVAVERDAGIAAGFPDAEYVEKGARIVGADFGEGDIVLKVQPPTVGQIACMREGAALIGLLQPHTNVDGIAAFAARKLTAFAMELMPRITRAQSMDALSSQANLAGYRSVLVAAAALAKAFPMMVTAAGTIAPVRVLVLGAGVAGLQAIATARRLGAIVEAYDVRPAVKEQVESLGARFLEIELEAADAEDAGGYARAQSEDFLRRQRELLGQRVAAADVVITTALVPGRAAPLLVEEEAVRRMRPGSVIVDMAAEYGGNCASSRPDETVHVNGVTVLGPTNLPSQVAFHASQTYARNVTTFVKHLVKDGKLVLDLEDEITRGALLCHAGEITYPRPRELAAGQGGG